MGELTGSLSHCLKRGLSHRIILQFNKLINGIWQVVSSALGGSRHSLQSHLRACSITTLTKAWTDAEREMTMFCSRSATSKVTQLAGVTLNQAYCIPQGSSLELYYRASDSHHINKVENPPYSHLSEGQTHHLFSHWHLIDSNWSGMIAPVLLHKGNSCILKY